MVLRNAERQKRFRERLKAAARGDDLTERAALYVDEAIAAVFAVSKRDDDAGFDDFNTMHELRADLAQAKHPTSELTELFQAFGDSPSATHEERMAIQRGAAIVSAAMLRHARQD